MEYTFYSNRQMKTQNLPVQRGRGYRGEGRCGHPGTGRVSNALTVHLRFWWRKLELKIDK